jgi:hypothetical protein
MTITTSIADQLDALGLSIFTGPSGLTGEDAATDAQLSALIAEPMLTIDGNKLVVGLKYTLNVTFALHLRPMHWFMELNEYNISNPNVSSKWPYQCGLLCVPNTATGTSWSANSYGYTIALATCAAICHAWANIIRLWLGGHYPLALNSPSA